MAPHAITASPDSTASDLPSTPMKALPSGGGVTLHEDSRRPLNLFQLMRPTFSGRPEEDVEMYINQCELAWVGSEMPASDLPRAQVTTLYTGLTGTALEFARLLPHDVRHSFRELSKKLRDRFQFRCVGDDQDNVWKAIDYLEQGTKTFPEYIEVGRNLAHSSESEKEDFVPMLIEAWFKNISEPTDLVKYLQEYVDEEREEGPVTFDRAVEIACDNLGIHLDDY